MRGNMNGDGEAEFNPCWFSKRGSQPDAMTRHAAFESLSDVRRATKVKMGATMRWAGFKPNRNGHLVKSASRIRGCLHPQLPAIIPERSGFAAIARV